MSSQLIERLYEHARLRPRDPALVQARAGGERPVAPARVITWSELAEYVRRFASKLQSVAGAASAGGPFEPPVALLSCPNQPEYFVAFLGALAAGATVCPVSPELAEPELRRMAEATGASVVLGGPRALSVLSDAIAADRRIDVADLMLGASAGASTVAAPQALATEPGLILQSSGTTGRPKLVYRSGASLDAMAASLVAGIGFSPSDRVMATVPLCHSYGMEHGLLGPIFGGACVHLCRGMELQVVARALRGSGITILPGVPFMYEILTELGHGVHFPSLRRAYSAGGLMPRSVADAFRCRYGRGIGQVYGATEIGSVTFGDGDMPDFFTGSVGWPLDGVEVRILGPDEPRVDRPLPVDTEGQVAVRAPSMLSRYVGEEVSPLVDGFVLTGDLGRLDATGALFPSGRLKLLIDVGGLKVNPIEVEELLAQVPSVGSCVVVAVPVSQTVSRLKAIVTPRRNCSPPDPDELRRFARQRLAPYKVPRFFEVRQCLPKSPTGKVLRHLVKV